MDNSDFEFSPMHAPELIALRERWTAWRRSPFDRDDAMLAMAHTAARSLCTDIAVHIDSSDVTIPHLTGICGHDAAGNLTLMELMEDAIYQHMKGVLEYDSP